VSLTMLASGEWRGVRQDRHLSAVPASISALCEKLAKELARAMVAGILES
jgi:hypothetical protein